MIRDQKTYSVKRLRSLITKENGWFGRDDFGVLLKREQELCRRSGNSLALILIEISKALPSLAGEGLTAAFLTALAEQVVENTRTSDLKCVLETQCILILFSDAGGQGCRAFVDKLAGNFEDHFRNHPEFSKKMWLGHLSISAYPPEVFQADLDADAWLPLYARSVIDASLASNGVPGSKPMTVIGDFVTVNGLNSPARELPPEMVPDSETPFDLQALAYPITANSHNLDRYCFFKRVIDIIGAVVGLILFAPVFILVALAIKFSSPGPVLFRQERVGYRGKPFQLLKFRTMRVNSNDRIHKEYVQKLIQGEDTEALNNGTDEQPQFKLTNDPRITRVGHILRKTSLDEIPQFINVLKGEMSLVGPRPPLDYEVEVYQDWHLRRLMEAKPGITGLWQAYSRNRASFDEMVRMDLQYVRKRSIWLDLKIIFKTFNVVFKPTGS